MDNQNTMSRRSFLRNSLRMAVVGAGSVAIASGTVQAKSGKVFEIVKTDQEWRALLGEASYKVLRHEDTERPGTSPLLSEKREGVYHCGGCDLASYASETKYESGTGWPSFYEALPGAVGTREDRRLVFAVRTEVHCSRCGGHFGHVFNDGPKPTGKRHCINGLSLKFKPKSA